MASFDTARKAIEAWKADIGPDAVISGPKELSCYICSVCASERHVTAVLKPASLEEVQKIVATANKYKVPLYPISCGKQWGMGSRLPVRDGAAIVDLGRMKRIIEVNAKFHYALVEPGVTQRHLLEHIEKYNLPLMLNVTGSTSDTSLIGNAMDRGVGYFDTRVNGISNMEVVLGSGETIQTGFGHYQNAKTKNLYHHGVGPSLDGLFPQANFGIVTAACIDLMPKPDDHLSAIIRIDSEDKLPRLIDELVMLRSRGIIQTIAHVGNRERTYITLAPLIYEQLVGSGLPPGETTRAQAIKMVEEQGFGPWSVAIGILGTKEQLKLAKKGIRKAFRNFAKTIFLNDSIVSKAKVLCSALSFIPAFRTQLMIIKAVEPVYGFTQGKTTDTSLKTVYWPAGDFDNLDSKNPDQTNSGVLYCLPIIPADGQTVLQVLRDTKEIFSRYGFEAAITVNLMNSKSLEGVISLAFDRRNKNQTSDAHACIQEMETRFMEWGFPPYRVGINSMHHVVREDDSFWRTAREIKKVLDPNGIIAPGRYNLH